MPLSAEAQIQIINPLSPYYLDILKIAALYIYKSKRGWKLVTIFIVKKDSLVIVGRPGLYSPLILLIIILKGIITS